MINKKTAPSTCSCSWLPCGESFASHPYGQAVRILISGEIGRQRQILLPFQLLTRSFAERSIICQFIYLAVTGGSLNPPRHRSRSALKWWAWLLSKTAPSLHVWLHLLVFTGRDADTVSVSSGVWKRSFIWGIAWCSAKGAGRVS